jgi:hypothetical protein
MSVQAETFPPDANHHIQSLMNTFPLEVAIRRNDQPVDWISTEDFEDLLTSFIQKKTEKFQAKALITQQTYNDAISALEVNIK